MISCSTLHLLQYQEGRIKEPSKSELVRYFVTLSLSIVRKEIPFLVTQNNNQYNDDFLEQDEPQKVLVKITRFLSFRHTLQMYLLFD